MYCLAWVSIRGRGMKVVFHGESRWTATRMAAARAAGWEAVPGEVAGGGGQQQGMDAVVIALSGNELIAAAEGAVRVGTHVFVDSYGPASVRESERLSKLASESGVQVGITRPLRFRREPDGRDGPSSARILRVEASTNTRDPTSYTDRLIEIADLCGILCGTWSPRRIDAESVRTMGIWPSVLAVAIRFQNRAVAHIFLRHEARVSESDGGLRVIEASDDGLREEVWAEDEGLFSRETVGFLEALAGDAEVPVSLRSGLGARRIVEEIMERLR